MSLIPKRAFLRRLRLGWLREFRRDQRANIAVMSAILAPVILGAFGLGAETTSWYASERSLQSAADSAAIAAASNAGSDYDLEAKAVVRKYGFVDGVDGVSVAAASGQACPGGGANCYKVTVSKTVPLLLAQFVGFNGDTTQAGNPAKRLVATAVAIQSTEPRPYCVVALAGSGANTGLRTNGAPKGNLAGCNVMSNTSATCNGHDLNADVGDAHGENDGCGKVRHSSVPTMPDPYAARASNIPTYDCHNSYPVAPAKKKDPPLPTSNQLSGSLNWSGAQNICGDVQLTGPVTIDTDSNGAVLYIRNGQLDTNGYTLRTSNGSALTIVFTGSSSVSYQHTPTGGGGFNFAAPTTGPWAGVAIYQDPVLTTNVDVSAAGNSPTWDITGLVYLPHANVTMSGAVNKSSSGKSCFVLVVDTLVVNGTGGILAHGECGLAGLAMPTNPAPSRGKLVS